MRTTVDIPDEQRAKLLELAARRGEKGFSGLIQEALEQYLSGQQKQEAIERALRQRGCLGADEADELEQVSKRLRGAWR